MRRVARQSLEQFRRVHPTLGGSPRGANYGFFVWGPLRIISSGDDNGEWEHVSVSCQDRCPYWGEMTRVKRLFWDDSETVLQFHPPEALYINHHPYCLHLWKQRGVEVVLPSTDLIA